MRVVLVSDTHQLHRKVAVPPGDLLIHAGDFTVQAVSPALAYDFNDWLRSLPHRHKIVVPGNHEWMLEEPRDRGRHWSKIPEGLDILITHGPPLGILDHSPRSERREGCPELLEAVLLAKPRVHAFGHIHAGFGTLRTPDTLFVNAALFGEFGTRWGSPVVLDVQTGPAMQPITVVT